MKLRQAKRLAVLLTCCAVLSGTVIAAGISAAAASPEPSLSNVQTPEENKRLKNQVQAWIDELAKQPPFAAWSGAEFTIEPLGPGTHGWYVVISAGGQPVGYMIVNAKESGGYELGEYGAGKRPLFDVETLNLSLKKQGVIPEETVDAADAYEASRLYANGLYAVWRIVTADKEVLYADAASGDILPATEQLWADAEASVRHTAAAAFPVSAGVRSHVYKVHSRQSFDVYAELPWLTTTPLKVNNTPQLLKPIVSGQPIRYVAQLYDNNATFMWGIVGYQQWSNDAVYLALEEPDPEGSGLIHVRYLSLSSLYPFGFFYR